MQLLILFSTSQVHILTSTRNFVKYQRSQDGDKFWKIPECYIRGNSIKYLRIPEEVIDLVAVEEEKGRE
jgi:hypothetical protein